MKKKFNLSDWALDHSALVWYFMIIFVIAGGFSYFKLGREEDPAFTIKTMVIQAQWPGASAEDVTRQVTERIEKKLEELDSLDYTRSVTTAGQTIVFLNLKATTKARDVTGIWMRARNMIGDVKGDFPSGVVGPFFNDSFGDVYGNIYAFTGDGLTPRQLRDYVEDVRSKVLTVPDIGKVDIVGAQDEVIYLEFSTRKIAALGIDQQMIINTLQKQNAVTPSGTIQAGAERVSLRVSGQFMSEESLLDINIRANDRFFRLSDVATIHRGYTDPPSALFRYNGKPAIALAVGMKAGANLLEFGKKLDDVVHKATSELPLGVDVSLVADQPQVVEHAVSGFTEALAEAVGIVLIVSFVSLGMRAGFVVALAIPLVLAITFLALEILGISLQRISLGALIIALGLLVDDAMIAVEMMVARLEVGDSLRKAATYVYTSTAFPMLTGTVVTVAGFIPVGLNSSAAGEFTFTLFVVIAVSLLVSWIVAVLFSPLLGVAILPKTLAHAHAEKGRGARVFSSVLAACLRFRWITIGVTLAAFALSLFGMGFVQQQFFPSSDRPEVIIDWNLPHNATIAETSLQMQRFEAEMLKDNADVEHWSSYVGRGAMRFVLSFDVQPADPSFGQMVILTKNSEARDRQIKRFSEYVRKTFIGSDVFIHQMDIGPPVGRPIQYRVSGPDVQTVRKIAQDLAGTVASNSHIGTVIFDWMEPIRVVKLEVMQDKARQLNVTSSDIASTLNTVVGGLTVTQLRDDIYLVNIVSRAISSERGTIETLQNLQLPTSQGQSVPLTAVARLHYELEQPTIWRRSRLPTITVKAGLNDDIQPATAVKELQPKIDAVSKTLAAGYTIALGGAVEESGKAQQPIIDVTPLMLIVMSTVLMIQLQSFSRLVLVFAVAPLALIGVVLALLPSGSPMGFVAILGALALIGILIRNSVILVVQIEELKATGRGAWEAVIEATEGRTRPIALTAAAASLGLIPIASEVFWGPMAYAMMGGIIVGTALTLLFLPALYVAWYRIKPSEQPVSSAETH